MGCGQSKGPVAASAPAPVDVSAFTSVPGLEDAAAWMNAEQARLTQTLLDAGQQHCFAKWTPGNVDKKAAFYNQVKALEGGYPGGIAAYVKNAKQLLVDSAKGANPFEGLKPEQPDGVKLEYGAPDFVEAENKGLRVFGDCACVLVAGGLGERLGYTDIKVSLPVQVTTGMTYMELYAQQILAMQAAANKLSGTSKVVPLAIMTSDDTHAKTVALLAAHANFGLAEGQVTIMKQEKVAALTDNDAHFSMDEKDAYVIDTKPHGHGDVHTLLASTGLADAWAAEGRKYIVFFQDTNALCFTVTTAAIGVSEERGFDMNSVCVPRKAKDAVGAITKLVKPDGSFITVNVEYNQLEPMLVSSGFTDGDVNDPATGFSPFPGNINQLIMRVGPYAAVLKKTGGLVPEFVNPKYADAAKSKFKKPTRLECMMQEHPKVMPSGSIHGYTQFPDWTYSPVKNSVDEARGKLAVGAPGRSAAEGELEYYDAGVNALSGAGVPLDKAAYPPFSVFGFTLREPPHIVLHPNFAVSFAGLTAKLPSPAAVAIAPRSTLVVEGPDVVIESLQLNGALVIKAVPGARVVVRGLKVQNAGWELKALESGEEAPDSLKIRGFKCVKNHSGAVFEFSTPGEYVLDENTPSA